MYWRYLWFSVRTYPYQSTKSLQNWCISRNLGTQSSNISRGTMSPDPLPHERFPPPPPPPLTPPTRAHTFYNAVRIERRTTRVAAWGEDRECWNNCRAQSGTCPKSCAKSFLPFAFKMARIKHWWWWRCMVPCRPTYEFAWSNSVKNSDFPLGKR